MDQLYPMRNILCIDLKSFFASCECVDRNLDPFTTPLVVADPARGNGAITLAITPCLKEKGIKSRGRIFEIPKNIEYLRVKPRMSLYKKKSSEVIDVYLDFIAKEDMHIYSIDEVFLDVTNYLELYKITDYDLAIKILKTIKEKTGLSATCGIGPNLFLAKVAMDVEAKKYENGIAKWEYKDIPSKLWTISPLSKVWGIGPKMEKKLGLLGINKIEDLAKYGKNDLIKRYGVMGEQLWNHANGIDLSVINDWKEESRDKSISHSHVLFKDYYGDNIKLIISEMIEVLTARLRNSKRQTSLIGFGISYSKNIDGGFYHSLKIGRPTDNQQEINDICNSIFDQYYEENTPIRKVSISFGKLSDKDSHQLSLFERPEEVKKTDNVNHALDEVHSKFGKNSLFKASALLPDSTIKERNTKIGGHSL